MNFSNGNTNNNNKTNSNYVRCVRQSGIRRRARRPLYGLPDGSGGMGSEEETKEFETNLTTEKI